MAVAAAAVVLLACAAVTRAHVERTAYWPWPATGHVPTARSLASALAPSSARRHARRRSHRRHRRHRRARARHGHRRRPLFTARARPAQVGGTTRVVCQADSLRRAGDAIRSAEANGYRLRPTEPLRTLSSAAGDSLLTINQRLFARCGYHEIQPAVTDSHNNDRVVVMPGVYTEPSSRQVPSFPAECEQYKSDSDRGKGAVSFTYQYHCPNAQSLVAVIGRAPGPGQDPPSGITGRPDPHGIPNLGPCIRCNLQIEGSGPTPDDTVLDAGRVESGNGAPIGAVKDVGLKADRADGFVAKNMTVRHAAEHDVYVLETDGYLLSQMKFFYGGEYGALMFTSDHGLTDTCEAAGNGDSGVYPGGAPSTGVRRDTRFYPDFRLNQTITHCDSHHNNLGYSGTMGAATHVIDNNFYDNTTGIATDSFFASGHPGYPQNSADFEGNRIYSNNFNVYAPGSDVQSRVPVPIGVGILIAGGDNDVITGNHIFDNWRRGTMLIAVPDAISCAPSSTEGSPGCVPQGAATTSNDNLYHDNTMGRTPDGRQLPNGLDFWWDEFPSNHGNCWYRNTGANGRTDGITSDPPPPPSENTSLPGYLPEDCGAPTNVGRGNPQKEAVLVACVGDFAQGSYDATVCDWFAPPARPSGQGSSAQPLVPGIGGRVALSSNLCQLIGGDGGSLTCSPFRHRLS
ncbi:MAG: hypothetical protein NVSMB25_18010 [Thermoleophilaceae bacterium]